MATEADLVARLKKDAAVQASEDATLVANSDELLKLFLGDALLEHNASYINYASLPQKEERLVLLLAWIKICHYRASRLASANSQSGAAGFGTDRNTPYYKNIDLAKRLQEQYEMLVSRLGVTAITNPGSIHVSELLIANDRLGGAIVPLTKAVVPPITLYLVEADATTITIGWTMTTYKNFVQTHVASIEGAGPLYQQWNFASASGVPRINDLATILKPIILDERVRSVRVENVNRALVNRFVVAVMGLDDQWGWSNELIVAVA